MRAEPQEQRRAEYLAAKEEARSTAVNANCLTARFFIRHDFGKWLDDDHGKVNKLHPLTGEEYTCGAYIRQIRICNLCGLKQLRFEKKAIP